MMKFSIVLTLFVAIMLCCSMALAESMGWGRGMVPGNVWSGHGKSSLSLTKEQSSRLQSLKVNYLKEAAPIQSRMLSLRSELRLLWNAANSDRNRITAKQKEISELQGQLDEKATIYQLDCRAMLTPEQQTQMVFPGPGTGHDYRPRWKHNGRW